MKAILKKNPSSQNELNQWPSLEKLNALSLSNWRLPVAGPQNKVQMWQTKNDHWRWFKLLPRGLQDCGCNSNSFY